MKKSEDHALELEVQLIDATSEKDSLKLKLDQAEAKLKKLEIITERVRELFGPFEIPTDDNNNCGICLENFDEIDHKQKIFNPCGHVACGKCAIRFVNSDCPYCRKLVKTVITPFL